MSTINLDELSEALNDKMDRDLNNRSIDSGLRKLVESYVNETSWYKIFDEIQSDGTVKKWCEQGGNLGSAYTSYQQKTINLSKPFADITYYVNISQGYSGNCYAPVISAKTTASFTAYNTMNEQGLSTWYACGYIS